MPRFLSGRSHAAHQILRGERSKTGKSISWDLQGYIELYILHVSGHFLLMISIVSKILQLLVVLQSDLFLVSV